MSVSTLSTSSAAASSASLGLILRANGEFTAASVAANPGLAAGLVRQFDGGYAYRPGSSVRLGAQVQNALISLQSSR